MGELSDNIEGIGTGYEIQLNEVGIFTLANIREANIFDIEVKTQLGLARLAAWRSMAVLQQIEGIDRQYAEGLVKCDITDLETLQATETEYIVRCLNHYYKKGLIPRPLSSEQVLDWKLLADKLRSHLTIGTSKLSPEVSLVWETMTCRGMRSFYNAPNNPCAWFNQYGPFHAYDVKTEDSLKAPEGYLNSIYAGKRFQIPELLSGCRKAPIMSVGLNPNLRAVSKPRRIYPYFDDIEQYAKHFRYRTIYKYSIDKQYYLNKSFNQNIEPEFNIGETIPLHKEYVSMYLEYKKILDAFSKRKNIANSNLKLGEDISYYNFVACHSPKWNMSTETECEIVNECFHNRQLFLRQLRQSAPAFIIIFSKLVMRKFVEVFKNDFEQDNIPNPNQTYSLILKHHYNLNLDGRLIRVVFSPHPTGSLYWYIRYEAQTKIVDALIEEFDAGNIQYDVTHGHLKRSKGPCSFCSNAVFKIGDCPYL